MAARIASSTAACTSAASADGLPDAERARHVAVDPRRLVAREQVEDDRLAGPQRAVAVLVRVGALRAAGRDRRHRLEAAPDPVQLHDRAQPLGRQRRALQQRARRRRPRRSAAAWCATSSIAISVSRCTACRSSTSPASSCAVASRWSRPRRAARRCRSRAGARPRRAGTSTAPAPRRVPRGGRRSGPGPAAARASRPPAARSSATSSSSAQTSSAGLGAPRQLDVEAGHDEHRAVVGLQPQHRIGGQEPRRRVHVAVRDRLGDEEQTFSHAPDHSEGRRARAADAARPEPRRRISAESANFGLFSAQSWWRYLQR